MRRTLLAAFALSAVSTGCGTAVTTPVAAPPTTATTIPTSPTVPSFGAPSAVLPATAPNATANATGACTAFDVLYLDAAQTSVNAIQARQTLASVADFADAAATGAPQQWSQLSRDVSAVVAVVGTPTWANAPHQDDLEEVAAVYTDCRPLQ